MVVLSLVAVAIFFVFLYFHFQRLRRNSDLRTAPLIAASIFLDILNVFLFFLTLFGRD